MSVEVASGRNGGSDGFQGNGEGYAKIRTFLAAVCAIAVLAYPWMNVLLLHLNPGRGKRGHVLTEAMSATIIWTVAVAHLRQHLSQARRLIANGGANAAELDRFDSISLRLL